MTTSELKSYIDRILGNSVRLLLPSYWWKKAFNVVIDNTISKDEVKTINGESIVGEGDLRVGVKSAESVEALEKLDARVGEIASVLGKTESATVKFADCYASVDYENDWDKYTIIRGVEETSQMLPESGGAVYLTASKDSLDKDCVVVGYGESRRAYMKYTNGKNEIISLQQANELLASGKYRAAIGYSASGIDQYFTFYTKVGEDTADAYIKSDSWEKLSKEYIVSSEEELNALSVENGTIAKVAYDYEVRSFRNTKISNSADKDFDRVVGLDVLSVPNSEFEISIYAPQLEANNKALSIVCYSTGRMDGIIRRREGNVSYREEVYNLALDYSIKADGVKKFNELLRSMDCLLMHYIGTQETVYALVDSALRFHIAITPVSDAYIKGETWTRLLKEGDAEIVVYADEVSQRNADAFYKIKELAEKGLPITNVVVVEGVDGIAYSAAVSYGELMESGVYVAMAQYAPIATSERVTITPRVLMLGISKDSEEGEAAAKIILRKEIGIVDSELSDTSENPVQNKVITSALNAKVNKEDLSAFAQGVNGEFSTLAGLVNELNATTAKKAEYTYVDNAIANAITNTLNTPV